MLIMLGGDFDKSWREQLMQIWDPYRDIALRIFLPDSDIDNIFCLIS